MVAPNENIAYEQYKQALKKLTIGCFVWVAIAVSAVVCLLFLMTVIDMHGGEPPVLLIIASVVFIMIGLFHALGGIGLSIRVKSLNNKWYEKVIKKRAESFHKSIETSWEAAWKDVIVAKTLSGEFFNLWKGYLHWQYTRDGALQSRVEEEGQLFMLSPQQWEQAKHNMGYP